MSPALEGQVDAPVVGEHLHERRVVVRGWHAWEGLPALAVAVTVRCGAHTATQAVPVGGEERPDVARATGEPAMQASGWRAVFQIPPAGGTGEEPAVVDVVVWGAPGAAPWPLPPIAVTVPARDVERAAAPPDARDPAPSDPVVRIDDVHGDVVPRAFVPLTGWALLGGRIAARVEIRVNGVPAGLARLGLNRADVAAQWSTLHALVSGFEQLIDLSALPRAVRWAHVTVRALDPASGLAASAEQWLELADADPDGGGGVAPAEEERRRRLEASARAGGGGPGTPGGPMNLAVFTHSLDLGGAQLWLTELLRRAGAGSRFACTVYSPASGPLRSELEGWGVEVHVSPEAWWRDRAAYDGRVSELATFLAAGGHDAVLANTIRCLAGADAALAAGCPVVWAIHESWAPGALWSTHFHAGEVAPGVQRRFGEVMRACAAVVFAADSTRRLYQAVLAPGRGVVVPYGVDLAAIDSYAQRVSKDEARQRLGIAPGERLLLVVGTTEPRKAQALIAVAFADAAAAHPQARLVMVGRIGTAYADALCELVDRSGLGDRMQVLPVVEDTDVWYRAADVLVSASDVESLPRTMLEAMAFGVPVAGTAVFGVPELLTHGRDGYLFEPCDLHALTRTLSTVLDEDPSRLVEIGAAGQATVEAGHDSAEYALDVQLLLEGLRADPSDLPGAILARAGRHPERRLTGAGGA